MNQRCGAALLIACLASPAIGALTYIDIKLRPWGTHDAWADSLTLSSTNLVDPIEVEVAVFYSRGSGFGMSTCVHNVVGSPYSAANGDLATILDRVDSTQHPDGRLGNFNLGAQSQAVYHTGTSGIDANRFRIGAPANPNDVPAGGISIKQNTPPMLGTNFDPSNPALGYHFKLSLACYNGGAARTVTIDAPITRINSYRVYDTASSTSATDILGSLQPTNPASVTVNWIPAPSSALLVAAGAGAAVRRRR